jgi:uncharacterized protein
MSLPIVLELSESLQHAFEEDDPQVHAKDQERGHVECIKRHFKMLSTADLAGFLDELDPDVDMQLHGPAMFPWIRRASGREAVRAAVAFNFSVVDDQRPQILTVVAQGNLVDVTLRETGRIKATQEPYDVVGAQQFVFRQGKLLHFREFIAPRTPDD